MTETGMEVQEGGKRRGGSVSSTGIHLDGGGLTRGSEGRPCIATHRLATGRGLPGQGPGQTLPAHAARLGDVYLDLPRFRLLRLGQMQG